VADLEVVWKGITLGGQGSYIVTDLTGWDELPGLNDLSTPRVRGHGDHLGDQFSQARTVTITGTIVDDPANRDTLALALVAASTVTSSLDTLAITTFDRQLFASARVTRSMVQAGPTYGVGAVPFALQWKCPDPLRYGPAQASVSTGLPTTGDGLVYPLVYPLAYGAAGTPGQVTLTNTGTAPAPFVANVTGSLPNGFELSSAGQRIRYETTVPSGETLTIDTGEGTVVAQGTADRRGNLTVSDWIQVPPLSTITVQFSSLGVLPAIESGDHTESFARWALLRYGEQLRQITQRATDAPDIRFQPRRKAADRRYIEWVMEVGDLAMPTLTQGGPDWVFDSSAPKSAVRGISTDEDASGMATATWVTGNGMEADMQIARGFDDGTLYNNGWPWMEVDESHSTVSDNAILLGYADALALRAARPIEAFKVSVSAAAAAEVLPGDYAQVITKGDPWLGDMDREMRVRKVSGDLSDMVTLEMFPMQALL
jgi:hypothetical protein